MVAVPLARRRVQARIGGFPRTGQHRHRMGIDDAGEFVSHHLVQMAQKAEPGHVGSGVDLILVRDLCRRLIQGGHRADGPFHLVRGGFAYPVGRADEPDAQCLGQEQLVAGAAGIVGRHPARVHKARHRKAVLHAGVGDGMPAREAAPRFGDLFGPAAQDLAQNVQVHALRKANEVQRRLHFAAHGVDIAQGVGSSDLPEGIGVVHHGWEKVHRLHEGQLIGDAVNGGVILAVVADQKVRILFAARQLFEDAAQHPRAELGRAAAARAEHDLFRSCHYARSPSENRVRTLRTRKRSHKSLCVSSPNARRAASSAWLRTA